MLLVLVAACGPSGQQTGGTAGEGGAAAEVTAATGGAETAATTAGTGTEATEEATAAMAGDGETATAMSETSGASETATAGGTTTTGETATTGSAMAAGETTTSAAGGAAAGTADYSQLSGDVIVDGSSTVEPISLAVAEEFKTAAPNVKVAVGRSGTGGGFEKFCNGETDISDASRRISDSEKEKCAAKNIQPIELQVGVDALALVTSTNNEFLKCLKAEQIVNIFKEGGAKNWNEIDPSFPNQPITIFAPDTDSGTYDYFTEHFKLRGDERKEPNFIGNYTASADDNVLVQGIQGSQNSIGFFGYSYYQENKEGLKAIAVDQKGDGTCVEPGAETVSDNSYPLSRPLFIYPSTASLQKPQVRGFVEYYMSDEGLKMVEEVDYFPAPKEKLDEGRNLLAQALQQ